MPLNVIAKLQQNTVAPLLRSVVFRDFGCTLTVQRATPTIDARGQTDYSYADDVAATNINATVMDAETALNKRIVGLVEGSTMLAIVPRQAAGMVDVRAMDRVVITSGPFANRTFVANARGNPSSGAAENVPLSEVESGN